MTVSNEIVDKIKNHASKLIMERNDFAEGEVNAYFYSNVVSPGQGITACSERSISVESDTVLVFVDEAPLFNWGHPCRYLHYDAESGDPTNEVAAEFPPTDFFSHSDRFEAFHGVIAHPAEGPEAAVAVTPALRASLLNAQGERYALLFSGMSNNRHVNDLEFLYRTLIDVYNFDAANITVLNHDGTINYDGSPKPIGNWPGDNTAYRMSVDGQGSQKEFADAIDELKGKLKENDLLLIHANNHGGGPPSSSQAYLCCCPNWGSYQSDDFGKKLGELPSFATLIMMMEQCHSGGFSDPVISNSPALHTSFAAACREDRSSIGGPNFDPFARDWIAAETGNNPDGSALSESVPVPPSATDAFNYANDVKHPYDTPVYRDSPQGCGATDYLSSKCIGTIALRAHNGQYVSAEHGGGHIVVANRDWVRSWETFSVMDLGNDKVALQASNGQFLCAEGGGGREVVANRSWIRGWETFTRHNLGGNRIALQAHNGQYLCAEGGGGREIVANRNKILGWETFVLVDIDRIALQAHNGQYLCAEGGGGREVVANRNWIRGWETFRMLRLGGQTLALQVSNGQYVSAEGGGGREVVANRNWIRGWETFKHHDLGGNRIALQAHNGQYLCAEGGGGREVVANRTAVGAWEKFKLIDLSDAA